MKVKHSSKVAAVVHLHDCYQLLGDAVRMEDFATVISLAEHLKSDALQALAFEQLQPVLDEIAKYLPIETHAIVRRVERSPL